MWKLNRITAQNLCAFKELDYSIKQGVTTLVFGDNRDNESQKSNGSGKSALIECIAVGITGSPLRKIKNEEIINDASDECTILLEFINNSSSEVFIVEREIFRKGSSVVRCAIIRDGKRVVSDEAVQHSVDAYTKYILEKLGITRAELFNNFILSKHKYEDFLSCSDKEKKDIINRFSNGIVVDEAIAKINEDILPADNRLRDVDLKLAGVDGRIRMLNEQIQKEEESKEQRSHNKVERINSIEQLIVGKRDSIRGLNAQKAVNKQILASINEVDANVQKFEVSEEPLVICYREIKTMIDQFGVMTDWLTVVNAKDTELDTVQQELTDLTELFDDVQIKVKTHNQIYENLKAEHNKFISDATDQSEQHKQRLSSLANNLVELVKEGESMLSKRRTLSYYVESLSNKISGTITCPKCLYEFLVSDIDFDVVAGRGELEETCTRLNDISTEIIRNEKQQTIIEQKQQEIQESRRKLNTTNSQWLAKVAEAEKGIQTVTYELESLGRKQQQITGKIISIQNEVKDMRRKMFDEAYEIVDSARHRYEREERKIQEEVVTTENSIETLYNTIAEINNALPDEIIDSLKASLKAYRKESDEVLKEKTHIEKEVKRLQQQELRFGEFKSYLANTKIEALSKITNEFLESIGSDIRIQFSGYTVLKTGKVREKISVSLIRDGIDCGSFGKFSEGEKARVNLSSILAMQKLVNSNCDADKGLDLLVLDEILAAVDEEGNSKMFESLNKLAITALVVSHGHVSESYPHTLIIRKENGESRII